MKKPHKIVMLPTEDSSCLCIADGRLYYYSKDKWFTKDCDTQPQHLYILSDDEIRKGDWFYNGVNVEKTLRVESQIPFHGCKKIIATTDSKLTNLIYKNEEDYFNYDNGDKLNTNKLLAQIPQLLIEYYTKHQPEEVELEYEWIERKRNQSKEDRNYKLKLQNNEVIISSFLCTYRTPKDSWTKEEYLRDIKQILDDLNAHAEGLPTDADIKKYINNWVDKKYNKF